MNDKVVYIHIRNDTNEIFYVGIGNKRRPYVKGNRSNFWKRIIKKAKGYKIKILYTGLSIKEAFIIEIDLIKKYGRSDLKKGTLVNFTNGGDGCYGKPAWNKGKKLSKNHKIKLKKNSGMAKKVINTKTGKIYNTISECANCNNLVLITLSQYLRGTRKNKTIFKFLENA